MTPMDWTPLPCPFCGNNATVESHPSGKGRSWSVICDGCTTEAGCDAGLSGYASREAVLSQWNRRVPAAAVRSAGPPQPELREADGDRLSQAERDKVIFECMVASRDSHGYVSPLTVIIICEKVLASRASLSVSEAPPAPSFPDGSYAIPLEDRLKAATFEFSHPRMGVKSTGQHVMPITTAEAAQLLEWHRENMKLVPFCSRCGLPKDWHNACGDFTDGNPA